MALEDKLQELIDAIEENTKAVLASGSASAVQELVDKVGAGVEAKPPKDEKPAAKPKAKAQKEEPTDELTIDVVRKRLLALGREYIGPLMEAYGIKKLPDLDESRYAEFMASIVEREGEKENATAEA